MSEGTSERDERRWRARPWLGFALQVVLSVTPLAVGVLAGRLAVGPLLPAEDRQGVLLAYAVAALVATVTVVLLQPLSRRLMPLAWLLRLQMLFPGRAPSRFKVARSRGRVVDLERALESGKLSQPSSAAERILGLVAVLTNHDRRTRGHAERVRIFTDLLSEEMGLPRDDRDRLRWAALLHDIGKLHVPRKVLNKPGKPDELEWAILKEHPVHGEQLLGSLHDWLGEWGATVRQHHERWDGGGYPEGLAGRQISLGARIVSVADAYEVMTAARSYKRPMAASAAREELVRCSGGQFDPAVVRAFMSIPLAKLRWALGPFAWVAELPLLRQIAHAGHVVAAGEGAAIAAGAAGTAAVTAATLVVGPPAAAAEPIAAGPTVEAPADPTEAAEDERRAAGSDGTGRVDDGGEGGGDGAAGAPGTRTPEGGDHSDPGGTGDGGGTSPGDGGGGGSPTEAPSGDGSLPDPTGPVDDVVDVVTDPVGTVSEIAEDPVGTVSEIAEDPVGTVTEIAKDPVGTVTEVASDPVGTATEAVGGAAGAVGQATETATETVKGLTEGLGGSGGPLLP